MTSGASGIGVLFGTGSATPFGAAYDTSQSVGMAARSAALGDFNGDGHLDLVVGSVNAYATTLNEGGFIEYRGDGAGHFTIAHSRYSGVYNGLLGNNVIVIDINDDGYDDVIIGGLLTTWGLYGSPTGLDVANPVIYSGQREYLTELHDIDGDGHTDWAFGHERATGVWDLFVYLDKGPAFPTSYISGFTAANVFSMSGGDLDGDGVAEFLIGNHAIGSDGAIAVYRGRPSLGPATGAPMTTLLPPKAGLGGQFGTALLSGFDDNGDGGDDLIASEKTSPGARLRGYPGIPGGVLHLPTWDRASAGAIATGTVWSFGDVTGDGLDDVFYLEGGNLHLVGGVSGDDADSDGTPDLTDCAPLDPNVHPGAPEIVGDGLDQNCDGYDNCWGDGDHDGYGVALIRNFGGDCSGTGEAAFPGDCQDANPAIHPKATELVADGIDQDCTGGDACYEDHDEDGHGTANVVSSPSSCAAPGYSGVADDCDDAVSTTFPGAADVCNGVDDDCSATADDDPSTFVAWFTDADCDGTVDQNAADPTAFWRDGDGDGFGAGASTAACDAPAGWVGTEGDCDDADATVHPGAVEACDDPRDVNCDGSVGLVDVDHDGWAACHECDDDNAAVHPGAVELCNGIDDNCDATIDESGPDVWYADADGDGHGAPGTDSVSCDHAGRVQSDDDCNDQDTTAYPGATEIPGDGIDQDCDGADTPADTDVPIDTDVPVDTDTDVPVDTDTDVPVDTDTDVPVDTDPGPGDALWLTGGGCACDSGGSSGGSLAFGLGLALGLRRRRRSPR